MRVVLVDEVAMLGTLNFIEQSVRLFIASSMPSSCGSVLCIMGASRLSKSQVCAAISCVRPTCQFECGLFKSFVSSCVKGQRQSRQIYN